MCFSEFFAVIPAAGQGSRMGSKTNKQFLELGGKPVIARTLLVFDKIPEISGIVISARKGETDELREICCKYGIKKIMKIVEGGNSRQDSVKNCLDYLSSAAKGENAFVLIHDGARPFIDRETIKKCMECVLEKGACGVGVPVKDTIKQTGPSGRIEKTIDRNNLWSIQTPQAFLLKDISMLHSRAKSENLSFTDDTAIYEYYNRKSYMVTGSYRNIKITTKEDLLYGEILLKE